ncbi:hypothetical protein LIER_41643 [Lithospermum erythrorhizon]|uniref:Uncharacterized protein n=1 Tax=Lithospermum erythrorhizon TaxID=34254 RepID=A0AAV3RG63_LITER
MEELDVVDVQRESLVEEYPFSTISEYSLEFKNDWTINLGCSNHMTGDEVKTYKDLEITRTPVIEGRTLEVVNVMSAEEDSVDKVELPDIKELQEHVEFKLDLDPSQDEQSQVQLRALTQERRSNSKYIDVAYAEVKETTTFEERSKTSIRSKDQNADIFTKAMPRPKFGMMRTQFRVTENS